MVIPVSMFRRKNHRGKSSEDKLEDELSPDPLLGAALLSSFTFASAISGFGHKA